MPFCVLLKYRAVFLNPQNHHDMCAEFVDFKIQQKIEFLATFLCHPFFVKQRQSTNYSLIVVPYLQSLYIISNSATTAFAERVQYN